MFFELLCISQDNWATYPLLRHIWTWVFSIIL